MNNEKKKFPDLAILGINLAVFAVYTGIGLLNGEDAAFAIFVMSVFHAGIAVVIAIVQRRWIWVLAALLVFVIGFGTCVSNFHMSHN